MRRDPAGYGTALLEPEERTDEPAAGELRATLYRVQDETGDLRAALHRPDPEEERDLERTEHALGYVEEALGEEAAYRLREAMNASRNLALRRGKGTPAAYGGDTHEQFVQCVADIPETVAAKEAVSHTPWSEEERRDALEHEVNRMGYRQNLEIQDRLTYHLRNGRRMPAMARNCGFSEETVEMVAEGAEHKRVWAEKQMSVNDPTAEKLEAAADLYLLECRLEKAMERGDEEAVRDAAIPPRKRDELRERALDCVEDANPEMLEAIEEALDAAWKWDDKAVRDGAVDFRYNLADMEFRQSNGARLDWLAEREDGNERRQTTGDCVTRALNEVTGGANYGEMWEELTAEKQLRYPTDDADTGVKPYMSAPVYERRGLHQVLETDMNDPMAHHLDKREIPELLGDIFQDPEEKLKCVVFSENHATALVDGRVHDSWDSKETGGDVVSLWIRTDDLEAVERARETMERYREARRLDEALTYGQYWRERIGTGGA